MNLPLTDISIKLPEYRIKWTRRAKIEQKLLNMKRENILHVHLVNLFLLSVIASKANFPGIGKFSEHRRFALDAYLAFVESQEKIHKLAE